MTVRRFLVLVASLRLLVGCSAAPGMPGMSGAGIRPGRDCLVAGEYETEGFGAYSYLLLRKVDERSIALLKAYLTFPDVQGLLQHFPSKQIDLTYVPVTHFPFALQREVEPLADAYDVPRALWILKNQEIEGEGPFIVTASVKLASITWQAHHLGIIDLSHAPSTSMPLWADLFVEEALHPDRWIANGASALALSVHDRLAAVGQAGRATLSAVEDGTKVLKAVDGGS